MPLIAYNFKDNVEIGSNTITLKEAYLKKSAHRFKKITGSRFAAVLGMDKYKTPFMVWMDMVHLFKDDMDPTLANSGNVIEPKIRDFVTKQLNIQFLFHDPFVVNFDVFKSNNIFGGIPDGEPTVLGKIDYSTGLPMLEIKTSSIDKLKYGKNEKEQLRMQQDEHGCPIVVQKNGNKSKWWNEKNEFIVSPEYQMQLGLYLHLRKATYGIFAVGFLEIEDYVKPNDFDPTKREIRLLKMKLDDEQFLKYINQATTWYQTHIVAGVSPAMNENDLVWFKKQLSMLQ